MREVGGSGARPLSLRDSRSSLQEVKVPGGSGWRSCAEAQQLPKLAAAECWAEKLSSNLRRVDLRLTYRPRGNLKIGKKDFKATSDLQRLSVI